jgi:ABC-2 type transport system permease protein
MLFSFGEIFTYYIVGGMLAINNGINYNMANSIKSGGITTRQLRPSSVWLQCICNDFGWQAFSTMVEICILGIVGFVGRQFLIIPTWDFVLLGVLAFLIGIVIRILINLISGMMAFFVVDAWGSMDLINQLNWNLSGKAIPLNIVSVFLTQTPFAFLYFIPIQIYLGKYTFDQTLLTFGGGIAWCILLFVMARIVFKAGLKRNEAVGL